MTGTIADDGTVGPIGGVVQKVAAVKRAGLRTFIYPAATPEDEQEQMRRIAGDDVELVPGRHRRGGGRGAGAGRSGGPRMNLSAHLCSPWRHTPPEPDVLVASGHDRLAARSS